jgi:C4-dicarboxylate-specific signal transduction histidine kinase
MLLSDGNEPGPTPSMTRPHCAAPSWPGRRSGAGDLYAGNDLYGPHAAVVEERSPLMLRDLSEEPRWPTFRARVREAGFGACWSWPILSSERVLGTLALYVAAAGAPEPEQSRVAGQLTHVASIAIERSRVETTLHQLRSELAHVGRVAPLGELTASIAHEVNQPLAGIVMNGRASLRWLERQPAEVEEARQATLRLLRDATRASETIGRLRDLFRKGQVVEASLDLEELIGEVLLIAQNELTRHAAGVVASLASAPPVLGDRVQLQQVLINLILNGLEAMTKVEDRPRELRFFAASVSEDLVEVSVADSGVGAGLDGPARFFEPFVTSKPGGMGIGLSISRSIVEDHGGKIWAEPGQPYGMIFRSTLPRGR